jgi:uncharacterized membrane protein YebE (DUF533 family)
MIDVNKLLNSVLTAGGLPDERAPVPRSGSVPQVMPRAGGGGLGEFLSGNLGSLGSGALAGGLAGTLLGSKHTRKLAGTALQVGAVALIGGLAYKAYQSYREGKPIVPQSIANMIGGSGAPSASPPPPPATGSHGYEGFLSRAEPPEAEGLLVLRAMIAAAMADGRVDDKERARLIDRVEASGFSAEERSYLESLIAKPDTPAQLAAKASRPEMAAEVYLAAFVAIDADTGRERAWLDDLAGRLGLDPVLRQNIESAALAAEQAVARAG